MDDITQLYPMLEKISASVVLFLSDNWQGTVEEALISYYDFNAILTFMITYNENYLAAFGLPIFALSLTYLIPIHSQVGNKLVDVLTGRLGTKDFEYIQRISNAIYN